MSEVIGYTVVSIYRLKDRDDDMFELVGGVHSEPGPCETTKAVRENMRLAADSRDLEKRYEVVQLVKVESTALICNSPELRDRNAVFGTSKFVCKNCDAFLCWSDLDKSKLMHVRDRVALLPSNKGILGDEL